MTNKIEISRELGCPFCGSDKLRQVSDDGIHFTQCTKCEATGPTGFKRGEDDAIDWNTRAAPAVERQEPVEWRYRFTHRGETSKWFPVDSYMKLYNIGNDPAYEIQSLYTSPPAPVEVVLPRYTCIGKGGEYELLGSAIGAGTLKDMSSIPVYRDITTGQLFVRTPLDFSTRMACLDKVKEMNE